MVIQTSCSSSVGVATSALQPVHTRQDIGQDHPVCVPSVRLYIIWCVVHHLNDAIHSTAAIVVAQFAQRRKLTQPREKGGVKQIVLTIHV